MTAEDGEPVVLCRALRREYGRAAARTVALDGIDLEVQRGEIVAVVGPSGSGKSTLLHVLGAMDAPTSGEVRVAGRDLCSLGDREASRFRREELGFVFQLFNLIPTLTSLDNVALPARLSGTSAASARERAQALLERVGLADRAASYPDALSGGQQQRVALARALVNRPRLVLADEPTGALDRQGGERVLQLLCDLVREAETTLVMATHSDDAMAIADRVVRVEDGRVVANAGHSLHHRP